MRFFIPLLLCAMLIAFYAPRPVFVKSEGRLLTMQPYLLRAMSGYAHTLVGDFVWLKSRYVDETRHGDAVDAALLTAVFRAHVILDPHFTIPVRYAATYLASIPKLPLGGVELLEFSQSLNPDRFDLLINEALIRIGYDVPNSSERILELAKRIEKLPEKNKLVGSIVMDDWMIEMIAYIRAKEGKSLTAEDKLLIIEADLVDLLKQTENPTRRALIEAELEKVRSQKSQNDPALF
ncbi:MAG: hypothetical protein LBI57_00580 [Helicobacteraceae bacterium]|jgi:hypothetical protein|nr:hypothetical protein [Helicobacteraceae bacterium]